MKNVTILGATGTFGKALTAKLLADHKCHLTLVSRHATEVFVDNEYIRAVDCDATSSEALAKILTGQDVVFCAISGDELPKVAVALVKSMTEAGVKRLIFMGAVGIYNEIPNDMDGEDNVANNPDQIPNRDAVETIENGDLDYTILRPGYLKEELSGDMVITRKGEMAKGYMTSIPALADLCRLIIENGLYQRESISYTKDMTK